jgi:hypothetical protein
MSYSNKIPNKVVFVFLYWNLKLILFYSILFEHIFHSLYSDDNLKLGNLDFKINTNESSLCFNMIQ